MINKIINICNRHGVDVSSIICTNSGVSKNITLIKEMLIKKELIVDDPRIMMADLYKVTREFEIDNIDEIVSRDGYRDDGDCIVCDKVIYPLFIQMGESIHFLNTKQQTILKKEGYKVLYYKIKKYKQIREVYGYGHHPNLNTTTHQFCLDPEFLNSVLSIESLLLLENLLSHINIGDSYVSLSERMKIMELINED